MRSVSQKALENSLIDLKRLQEDRNVRLTIENMGSWDSYLFREPAFLDRLADLNLGFTLDVGHAHVNGLLETFLERGGAVLLICTTTGDTATTIWHAGKGVSISSRSCGRSPQMPRR